MIDQITIIGTGLIGGSFALAVRKHGFAGRIVGCDRDLVLARALAMHAIDAALADPVEACRGSQLVVLATPVGSIIDLIERLGPLLPADALMTDVGSTKGEIVARARAVFGDGAAQRFLGGHPMAGKEHSGIEHADADLFQNAAWLLTPTSKPPNADTPGEGVANDFTALLEAMGARIMTMDVDQHDRLCAWVSHLPQMISSALAASLVDEFARGSSATATGQATIEDVHTVGGRALREMTRIASSPYSMWRDIALTNSKNLEQALLRLEQRLAHIRENLRTPELRSEFEKANSFSPRKREGAGK
jgi:prephenate dehydrogenase